MQHRPPLLARGHIPLCALCWFSFHSQPDAADVILCPTVLHVGPDHVPRTLSSLGATRDQPHLVGLPGLGEELRSLPVDGFRVSRSRASSSSTPRILWGTSTPRESCRSSWDLPRGESPPVAPGSIQALRWALLQALRPLTPPRASTCLGLSLAARQ